MAARILIVDDTYEDLENMKGILKKAGYEVITATNGAGALEAFDADNFDLVLINIMMPTLSGYDLSKLLRERLGENAKMAYVSVVPRKKADIDGVDGFIQKPFTAKTFVSKVRKLLKKKKGVEHGKKRGKK